jgi:hypothetical protein
MDQLTPIKLPHDLEIEEEEARIRAIEERIQNDRENNTLVSNLLAFLLRFETKVIEYNQYIQLYTPYSTISQTIKDILRNKLRTLNEFYFSYTGSNPHPLIVECMEKDDADVPELKNVYNRLSILLSRLNNNTQCVANKQVIFVARQKPKEEEYDWT